MPPRRARSRRAKGSSAAAAASGGKETAKESLSALHLLPGDRTLVKEQLRKLRRAQHFNDTEAQLDKILTEYAKMMALKRANPDADFSPSSIVDMAWLSHIICTEAYARYCQDNFGHFVHHDPSVEPVWPYQALLDAYKEHFGCDPPELWWPEPTLPHAAGQSKKVKNEQRAADVQPKGNVKVEGGEGAGASGSPRDVVVEAANYDDGRYDKQLLQLSREGHCSAASELGECLKYITCLEKALSQTRTKREELPVRIFVKTLLSKTITLHLPLTSDVLEAKHKIKSIEGIPADQQRLIYRGRMLEDGGKLSDYGVEEEMTIDIVLRLRGGKPVVLLYPERQMTVSVGVDLCDRWEFSALYPAPASADGGKAPHGTLGAARSCQWNVLAFPDGTLMDMSTQRQYPYLFWEAETVAQGMEDLLQLSTTASFCVSAESAGTFLDDVLQRLGLNVRERCDMVTYWLPKMLKNRFNHITFVQQRCYEEAAKLRITPVPDVLIRVFMTFKGVPAYEQAFDNAKLCDLTAPQRSGFVAVEWGGMDLDEVA